MKRIEIEWLEDEHDCDDCGTSWARGARGAIAFVDGNKVFELIPNAHCYGGTNLESETEVYKAILDSLGYNVVEKG